MGEGRGRVPPSLTVIGFWRLSRTVRLSGCGVGVEAAETNLRAILQDVFAKAGVNGVKAASAGVASATMPGVKEWIAEVFSEFGVERSEVVGDEVIALDGAFKAGPEFCRLQGRDRTALAVRRWRPGERGRVEFASRR